MGRAVAAFFPGERHVCEPSRRSSPVNDTCPNRPANGADGAAATCGGAAVLWRRTDERPAIDSPAFRSLRAIERTAVRDLRRSWPAGAKSPVAATRDRRPPRSFWGSLALIYPITLLVPALSLAVNLSVALPQSNDPYLVLMWVSSLAATAVSALWLFAFGWRFPLTEPEPSVDEGTPSADASGA